MDHVLDPELAARDRLVSNITGRLLDGVTDVLERCVSGFKRGNFVDTILNSDWPE